MENPRVRFSGGELVTNAFFKGLSLHWCLKGFQARGSSSSEWTCLQYGKPRKIHCHSCGDRLSLSQWGGLLNHF